MEKIYYVVEDDYMAFENYDDALLRCADLGIYAADAMIWECPESEAEDYEIQTKTNNQIIFEKMEKDLNEIIGLFGEFASKYDLYAPSFTIVIDQQYDELRIMDGYYEAEINAYDMGVSLNLNTNLEKDWE